jgi:hypothetical protein
MVNGSDSVMGKFCFIKDSKTKRLIPCNLAISTARFLNGFTMGHAIMEEIDKGPVAILCGDKVIGNVTGYKIVRNRLKYIEEYFGPENFE